MNNIQKIAGLILIGVIGYVVYDQLSKKKNQLRKCPSWKLIKKLAILKLCMISQKLMAA